MIHLIYIYFLINSYFAYRYKDVEDGFIMYLMLMLFGLVAFIFTKVYEGATYLFKKSLIKAWYLLYFTDYYANPSDMFIKIRTQQYHGWRLNKKENSGWYDRFFIRKLDKKYNMGITNPK